MSDQPSENHLRTLILKWRERAYQKRGTFHLHSERSIQAMRQCADELEAALAEGVPPAEPGVPGSEVLCEACAKVFCPHGERLHFHHDGCPACCDDEHGSASVPPAELQTECCDVSI